MGIVEYKLEKGCICLTTCPALITKEDGNFVLVGSTACMLCVSNRKMTFFEDGSGGMVKCDKVRGPEMPMRGVKDKPSLARALKEAAEATAKGREIRAKRKEMAEKLREERAKRVVKKNNSNNKKTKKEEKV